MAACTLQHAIQSRGLTRARFLPEESDSWVFATESLQSPISIVGRSVRDHHELEEFPRIILVELIAYRSFNVWGFIVGSDH